MATPVIRIYRGKQYLAVIDFVDSTTNDPLNISARTYRAQIRSRADGMLVTSFTCQTSAQGSGLDASKLLVTLSSTNTDLLIDDRYVTDLEETVAGVASIILDIDIAVKAPVTQDV